MTRRAAAIALLLAALLAPDLAGAAWNASGSVAGNAKGETVSAGAVPAVSVSGRNVTVTWTAASLSGGGGVSHYLVKRYDASSGVAQTIGSGCSGTVSGLSCTESAVPAGAWKYSVTPVVGPWSGAESDRSGAASVAAASLTLSGPTTLTSLPGSLGGSVGSFVTGETLTFRLDDPVSGPLLSGSASPATIPTGGGATVAVTIPSGTSNGSHVLYALGSAGTSASATFTVSVDTTPPSVAAATLEKSEGGVVAFVRQGGTYRIYASASDPGSPSSGIASVTANVSAITSGQTAVALSAGSYTAGGVSYNYRSAQLTAGTLLGAGSYSFSITAADGAGNTTTQIGFTVTVDNTAPAANDVQTTNTSGGTNGRPETGDTISYTYSETLDRISVLAGWSGTASVTVRLVDGGLVGNDAVQVWDSANAAQLPLGQVNLGRTDFVSASASFGSSSMTQSGGTITITLGTLSGTVGTAAGTGTMAWTPSASPFDWAGNVAVTTLPVTESGMLDRDF